MTFVLSSRAYWPTAQLTVVFTAPVAISTRFPGLTLTEPLPLQVTPALKAQVMFVLLHDDGEVQRRNVRVPVTLTLL